MKNYDKELTELAEKLTDVALDECDPRNWPGANSDGTLPPANDMTAAERGDLVWTKKSAAGTLGLLQKVHSLIGAHEQQTADSRRKEASKDEAAEFAENMRRVEAEAADIMTRLGYRTSH